MTAIATLDATKKRGTSPLQLALRNLRRNRSAMIGFWVIVVLVVMGVFAPWIATHNPEQPLINVDGYEGITKGLPPCFPALNYLGCGELDNTLVTVNAADIRITLQDETRQIVLNNGQARIVASDLTAMANLVHVVDGILTPPPTEPYSFNITALTFAPPLLLPPLTSGENGEFSILLRTLTETPFGTKLAASVPFTLLAPTDQAFEAYFTAQGITEADFLADPAQLERVLSYHVLGGRKPLANFDDAASVKHSLHIMGVDLNLRDEFSRVVYGVRLSLPVGFAAVFISISIGTLIGLVSGFLGGWADNLIMRTMDVLMAFPSLLLAIAIVTILGPGLLNALIAIAIVSIPQYARIIRASVLSVKEQEYITANRALGAGAFRLIFIQILPNAITPIIVQGTLGIGTAILEAAALSFLGLGAQPPVPEWGLMLSEARADFRTFPHLMFFPGIAIMITVLAFNLLGDGVRDVLDPRLNKR
ncbi:MAG: ABC transporter permease subunit [Phototrophicaceae bacterium]